MNWRRKYEKAGKVKRIVFVIAQTMPPWVCKDSPAAYSHMQQGKHRAKHHKLLAGGEVKASQLPPARLCQA